MDNFKYRYENQFLPGLQANSHDPALWDLAIELLQQAHIEQTYLNSQIVKLLCTVSELDFLASKIYREV